MVPPHAPTNPSITFFRPDGGVAPPHQPQHASQPSLNPHLPQHPQLFAYSPPPSSPSPHTINSSFNPLAVTFVPNHLTTESTPDLGSDCLDIPYEFWDHFLDSEPAPVSSRPPPCTCHNLPIGSCPENIKEVIERVACTTSVPGCPANMDYLRIPLPRPSFPLEAWKSALNNYFDAPELLRAFEFGWDMSLARDPTPRSAPRNLPSAFASPGDIDSYIGTELSFGALVGPLVPQQLPFPVYHNPIASVPKARSDVRRTIVDCSQRGAGINSWIPSNFHRGSDWKITLPTTESIVDCIRRTRLRYPDQRLFMFKIDFSRFYRWFFLDPGQVPFLAIKWKGNTYLDLVFSFGNRGAALCAQRTSWAVCHTFRTQVPPHPGTFNAGIDCKCTSHCSCGENEAVSYIDDCIAVVPEALAFAQYEAFLELANRLGLTLSKTPGHLSPPAEQCIALGILFDLSANTVSLPADKVASLLELLVKWLARLTATERDLASLAGRLLYASRVIRPGRTFLNRVLATKRRAAVAPAAITLDEAFHADLKWWHRSLVATNGISFLDFEPAIEVTLDASSDGWYDGLPGLGGFNLSTGEYFACTTPPELSGWHISDLELVCHLLASRLWSTSWRGLHILGHTDNQACFFLLSKGKSRVDQRLRMARTFASLQLEGEFMWESAWISTHDNILADALSRSGEAKYRKIFLSTCSRLGFQPRECVVSPSMFHFETGPE